MRMLPTVAFVVLLAGCAGPSALQVIDNVLSHEGPAPPASPLVRALLARPLDALDASAIFDRSVPEGLARLVTLAPEGPPIALHEAIEPFLADLVEAQRALRAGASSVPMLRAELPPPALQRALAVTVDPTPFLDALARFLRQRVVYPAEGARFARGDVVVVIGSAGDDVHDLVPVRDGAVSVLIDPGGNDHYRGRDVVLHGLAAIVDLAGDDRYESDGPAWGAAIAGVSLLLDVAGDDVYVAGEFALGAALGGLGAVLDLAGNDRYRIRAFGQGLGLAGGTGLLWDRAGNDGYEAEGVQDRFDRGGGVSFAQGAALGVRTGMGGGIGILRDDGGDDTYEAQLFAQGTGYYYGVGLLWDRGGNDRYLAARYAQGAGVHQAVGVLRDDAGDDAYQLSVGVGQGMGLDLAVGVLADASGDDRYAAPTLAQGAATANGVGILFDGAGQNDWRLDHPPGRGNAAWARGLPSIGLVLADAPHMAAVQEAPQAGPVCPAEPDVIPAALPLEQALRELGPGLTRGDPEPGQYAFVVRELRSRPALALAALPANDFAVLWPLGIALRCALAGADATQAHGVWAVLEQVLDENPATPYAGIIAGALRARPAPAPQMRRFIERLAVHPSCGVRTAALSLDGSTGAAERALRSTCWQLQARALRILHAHGVAPPRRSGVPRFLRDPPGASPAP